MSSSAICCALLSARICGLRGTPSDHRILPTMTSETSTQRRGNPVTRLIERYATPLTTGLFVVSAVSGTALFFHTSQGVFHEMHEWLSMILLLPFAMHLWKNWRPLLSYATRGTLILPLVAALAVAVPFAIGGMSGGKGGNPAFKS